MHVWWAQACPGEAEETDGEEWSSCGETYSVTRSLQLVIINRDSLHKSQYNRDSGCRVSGRLCRLWISLRMNGMKER